MEPMLLTEVTSIRAAADEVDIPGAWHRELTVPGTGNEVDINPCGA
jgi:hypothetical protein